MSLVKFKSYATPLDGEVEFASLESNGFHPVFSNYTRGTDDTLVLPTQSGVTILLPAEELEDAFEYIDRLEASSENKFDPLKPKRRPLAGPILLVSFFLTILMLGNLKAAVLIIGILSIVPISIWLHPKKLAKKRVPK